MFISRLNRYAIISADIGKSPKEMADIINAMPSQTLLLMNTNLADGESFSDEAEKVYSALIDSNVLNDSVEILNKEGVHGWICNTEKTSEIIAELIAPLEYHFNELDLTIKDPFTNIKVNLPSVKNESEIRLLLNTKWEEISSFLVKKEKEEEKEVQETPKEVKEDDKKETTPLEQDEDVSDEDELIFDDEDTDAEEPVIQEKAKFNLSQLLSLKNPYIFIIDPRKKTNEYRDFIGPDPKDARTKKASQVLPKAIKFYSASSGVLKSPEGYPMLVYFMDANNAVALSNELKTTNKPLYHLGEFDKELFNEDEPFSSLKIKHSAIDVKLADELNKTWFEATVKKSGNPIPALQASISVPLNYFRFLNKKKTEIKYYLGNRPEGVGSKGLIYVLASDKEAQSFLKVINSAKLPSVFYDRISELSDIDSDFKAIEPIEVEVRNVLILKAKDKFSPTENVEITDANKFLVDEDAKDIQEEIEQLKKRIADKKELENEIKELQEEIKDWNQLKLLHATARIVLGNTTRKAGTFIKSGATIGTHIAHFNANMTVCFLWGSFRHITIDTKKILNALPFVKEVNTSYL